MAPNTDPDSDTDSDTDFVLAIFLLATHLWYNLRDYNTDEYDTGGYIEDMSTFTGGRLPILRDGNKDILSFV